MADLTLVVMDGTAHAAPGQEFVKGKAKQIIVSEKTQKPVVIGTQGNIVVEGNHFQPKDHTILRIGDGWVIKSESDDSSRSWLSKSHQNGKTQKIIGKQPSVMEQGYVLCMENIKFYIAKA